MDVVKIHELCAWLRCTPLEEMGAGNGVGGMIAAHRHLGGDYVPHTYNFTFPILMDMVMDTSWVSHAQAMGVTAGSFKSGVWHTNPTFIKLLQSTHQFELAQTFGVDKVQKMKVANALDVVVDDMALPNDERLRLFHDYLVRECTLIVGEDGVVPYWDKLDPFVNMCCMDILGGQMGTFDHPDVDKLADGVIRGGEDGDERTVEVALVPGVFLRAFGVMWKTTKGVVSWTARKVPKGKTRPRQKTTGGAAAGQSRGRGSSRRTSNRRQPSRRTAKEIEEDDENYDESGDEGMCTSHVNRALRSSVHSVVVPDDDDADDDAWHSDVEEEDACGDVDDTDDCREKEYPVEGLEDREVRVNADTQEEEYHYYVKWVNFPRSRNTWEPRSKLLQSLEDEVLAFDFEMDFKENMAKRKREQGKRQCRRGRGR